MDNYKIIIKDYSQESTAITASILLRYLEGFTRAREMLLLDKSDPILKSRKLVNLLAYEQALKIIEDIEARGKHEDLAAIQYFKARCYSGLGQPEKAVETYLKVITESPGSPYAKYSNRKLYNIGKSAGGDNKILDVSKNLNRKLNDPVLNEIIKESEKDITASDNDVPLKLEIPANLTDAIEKMSEQKTPPAETLLTIITNDGNTFKGHLIEKRSDIISIQTSIGRIDVKTNRIAKVIEQK